MRRKVKTAKESKKEILNCARKLLNEKSYEELRLSDILHELDFSKGGFYHHFKSMRDLLRELIHDDISTTLKKLRISENEDTALNALKLILKSGSEHLNENKGVLFQIHSKEGKQLYLDLLEEEFDDFLVQILANNFVRGMETGEYKTQDPKQLANLFVAANTYGNRKTLTGSWTTEDNLSFSIFSLSLLSETLGVGNTLTDLFFE